MTCTAGVHLFGVDLLRVVTLLHVVRVAASIQAEPGFVRSWLDGITSGGGVPVSVQLCPLQPASQSPKTETNCSIAGNWTYRGGSYVYTIVHQSARTFNISSDATTDPWLHAHGEVIEDIEAEEGGSTRLITVRLNPKELGQYEALA